MANRIITSCIHTNKFIPQLTDIGFKRFGHTLRGKPPGVARSLEKRLKDENPIDAELFKKIDIGFPMLRPSRSEQLRERLDLKRALSKSGVGAANLINLEQAKQDWIETCGPFHLKKIADHYKVFEHLFGQAYFTPRVQLNVKYTNNEVDSPVFYGNVLKPEDVKNVPEVTFNSNFSMDGKSTENKNSLWTLVLTNPDGLLDGTTESNNEYVHWMVSNISESKISTGDEIVPYLQAFPPKGTGYHRFVFILYKQEVKINLDEFKVDGKIDLNKRVFNTFDFYKKHQQNITPAGLAFFQSDWDKSVTDFFHNKLETKEPRYEYDFPKAYIKDQAWFPLKQPFNLYMDKYRNQQDVAKGYLAQKLNETHPFDGPKTPLRFPNAHSTRGVPSWLATEMRKNRLKWGRINDV